MTDYCHSPVLWYNIVRVPWLTGSPASIPGLAETGELLLSAAPSSSMIGWAGGRLLWSLVGSSLGLRGEVLGGVTAFSGEVLSLARSRQGWGRNTASIRVCCVRVTINFFSFCFTCCTHTLLGTRGRCPSGPRALCFSSCFLSLWSSSPISLPASSGKTKTRDNTVLTTIQQSSVWAWKVKTLTSSRNTHSMRILYVVN